MKRSAVYLKIWYVYVLAYVVLFSVLQIVPWKNFLENNIKFHFTAIGVLGVILLLVDFFSRRVMFRLQGSDILVLFLCVCMISVFVNRQYDPMGNLKCLMWVAVQVFVLCAGGQSQPRDVLLRRLCVIFEAFIFVWLIGALWSLGQYIVQHGGYYETMENGKISITQMGFMEGRLFGVFLDPNYGATCSLLAIVAAGFCMQFGRRPLGIRIYYGVSMAVQVCYVILSGSRTALLAAAVAVFFGAALLTGVKIRSSGIMKAVVPVLAAVCSVALLWGGYKVLQTGLSYLPYLGGEVKIHIVEENPEDSAEENLNRVDFTRADVANKSDYSNNRFAIWADYWKVLKTSPVVGVSPRSYLLYAEDHFEDLFVIQRQYSVHNGYLMLFVGAGLLGGGLMVLWAIYIVTILTSYLIRHWNDRDAYYWAIVMLMMALIVAAVSAFPLQGIFFCNQISDVLFWLILGYVLCLLRKSEPERYTKKPVVSRICDRIFCRGQAEDQKTTDGGL